MACQTGNLTILISDDEDEDDDSPKGGQGQNRQVKEPCLHQFKGLEAAIVDHFWHSELNKLAQIYHCSVMREPNYGQPENLTIKQLRDEYTSEVKECLDHIRGRLRDIQRQEHAYTKDVLEKVKSFILEKSNSRTIKTYLYNDESKGVVTILGESFSDVDDTSNELKIRIGLVKPTNRAHRQLSMDDIKSSTYESTESPKYRPPRSNHGFSSQDNKDKFSFEVKLAENFVLKVYKASITKIHVDSIVNAANDNLMHGGGVARVISRAAGYKLDTESQEYVAKEGLLKVTKNCLTTAGNLSYKSVIHAVGPQWHDYKDKILCMDNVYDTVFNVLLTCDKKGYASVGIPAISAGIYGVPKVLCADMYVKAAVDFSKTYKRNPREMHFIDVDMEILQLVKDSVEKWQKDPDKINQRYTVPELIGSRSNQRSTSSSQGPAGNHGYCQGQSRRNRTFGRQVSNEDHSRNMDDASYAVGVEQFDKESFRWGGVADVFLVGGAITVKIFNGTIDKVRNLDALVCGIDSKLESTGFVAKALKKEGGTLYERGLRNLKSSHGSNGRIGDVFCSDPGNLGVKKVMHLVNERVSSASKEEVDTYKRGIHGVLAGAKQRKFTSLALPMIGTGNIQGDKSKLQKCCSALLHAICDFCSKEREPSVTEVHLINNSTQVCDALGTVFKKACDMSSKSASRTHERTSSTGRDSSTERSPTRHADKRAQSPANHRSWESTDRNGSFHMSGNRDDGLMDRDNSRAARRTYTADGRKDDLESMEIERGADDDNDGDGDGTRHSNVTHSDTARKGNLLIIEDD